MGVILESYFSNLQPFECHIHVDGEKYLFATVSVKYFKYPEERIKVDQKTIELSAPDLERVNREQLMLNKIYTEKSDGPYFMQPFISPLDSYVTSYYGKRRVFNNKKKSQHLGIDFRAQVGVPVPSTNSGKVVYSGDLFFTGYTVILYHGLDIYSVYGHLSKLYVKAGEMVNRGQLLGLSGDSGRVSGPHLHWGVKIRGNYIDGFSLIDETQKLAKK
jgi:murein DD-endopeptidase MepM/ murein hydrolase activator NlpD